MKIAYINADPDVPVFGTLGCSVHVQEVLLAMLKLGAEVHLFTTRIGDEAPPDVATLIIHPLPKLPRGDVSTRERAALATNNTLLEALARESADKPFDLIYERHSLWCCAAMEFGAQQNIPAVLEVNAPLLEEAAANRALANRSAAEEVQMRVFRAATIVTAVSRQLAAILDRHPSVQGKLHVVPNAVAASRFIDVAPSYPKGDDCVVGFVGALRPWQGLTTLVEGFNILAQDRPNSRLLIVGDGPERERLERELAARDLTAKAQLTGAVLPEAVPGLLASMDVAVAPYPPLGNFYLSPLKLYEYLAAGLPVIASRIGQVEEIITHNETGLLMQPGDITGFANHLRALQKKAALRSRLGNAGRASVQEHTWDDLLRYVFTLVKLPIPHRVDG